MQSEKLANMDLQNLKSPNPVQNEKSAGIGCPKTPSCSFSSYLLSSGRSAGKAIEMKRKHLSFEERIQIEQALNDGQRVSVIAKMLSRPAGTVSKEIQRNRAMKEPKAYGRARFHFCELGEYCMKRFDTIYCRSKCPDFTERTCPDLYEAPYVCNGCAKKSSCYLRKFYYKSGTADSEANKIKMESRSGADISPEELASLDSLISPLIRQGQPLAHIYETHKEEIPVKLRTLYTYVDKGMFSIGNLDLRRKVKYKQRKKKHEPARSKAYRENQTYQDFLKEAAADPELSIVEMDTVEGSRDDRKCILTLFFRSTRLMLIRLLPEQTIKAVVQALNSIEQAITLPEFSALFGIILTDNGHEFIQPEAIEGRKGEFCRTRVYYCDPGHSEQKGAIEKNHEYIRYILPKGTSFEGLTAEAAELMASHINSTLRPSLGGKTPFEAAAFLWPNGLEVLEKLHIRKVAPDDVILTPDLIR